MVRHHWKHIHNPAEFEELALFYSDNSIIITGIDQARGQASLDAMITSSFETVGLKMNTCKIEFMVMMGGKHRLVWMQSAAYNQRVTGKGET